MGHMGVGLEPLAPPGSALAKIGGRINIARTDNIIRDRVGKRFPFLIKPARWNAALAALTSSMGNLTIREGAQAGAASSPQRQKKFSPTVYARPGR